MASNAENGYIIRIFYGRVRMEEFARFLAVADLGNMSRAAETLNMSQPTLSRTIAQLEYRYGTNLFRRGAGGMQLTEAGRILYDHASRALRLLRDAEERIDYEGMGGQHSLSICAGDSWGNAVLPQIVEGFLGKHPEIRLRLDVIGSEARMAGLAAGDYDVSCGITLPRHERLGRIVFEPILQAGYSVYCAADHPLRMRSGSLTAEDLRQFSWIKHKFEFDHDPGQWQVTGRTYAMSTNTMVSTLEVVRQTEFLISTSAISRDLFARHEVVSLGPDPLSAQHLSGLHTLREAILPAPARLFIGYCRTACRRLYRDFCVPGLTEHEAGPD
ncbi:LysR family transcriptional regulator [Jiella sonneratiae]|uniref:LysR family transcriptional regulator n=1 Tax=Jiella sonneratiae TaxID=2816856 RepID=A0ABS3J561_9HYPH|nr:LysR family transcriptional regulator [Jiella sonneratiae]MBO0904820.1 LysR family transcriptional regulator [Jiella sonneratiae]